MHGLIWREKRSFDDQSWRSVGGAVAVNVAVAAMRVLLLIGRPGRTSAMAPRPMSIMSGSLLAIDARESVVA